MHSRQFKPPRNMNSLNLSLCCMSHTHNTHALTHSHTHTDTHTHTQTHKYVDTSLLVSKYVTREVYRSRQPRNVILIRNWTRKTMAWGLFITAAHCKTTELSTISFLCVQVVLTLPDVALFSLALYQLQGERGSKWKQSHMHAYVYTSTHTSIHPYIHTSIHPYIHTSIHTYVHAHVSVYVSFNGIGMWRLYVHTCICSWLCDHSTWICGTQCTEWVRTSAGCVH